MPDRNLLTDVADAVASRGEVDWETMTSASAASMPSRVSGPAGRRPQGRVARRSALPTGAVAGTNSREPLAPLRQGGDPAEELPCTAARTAHPDRADHHTGSLE